MTEDHIASFGSLFDFIYKGNKDASELSFKILHMLHTWDDLIDKDKEVSDFDINKAFLTGVFELQRYPIWFSAGLDHHLLNTYLRWRDATEMETKDASDDDLNKCYMLRAGLYDIFVIIAFHMYGHEWASEIGPKVRRFYGEKLEEFKKEVRDA